MKTEYRKYVVTFEMLLVVLPCAFWTVAAALAYLGRLLQSDALGVLVAALFLLRNVYFSIPSLVAPSLFDTHPFVVQPAGVLGWVMVVSTYAIVALIVASVLFLMFESRGNKRKPQNQQVHGTQQGARTRLTGPVTCAVRKKGNNERVDPIAHRPCRSLDWFRHYGTHPVVEGKVVL